MPYAESAPRPPHSTSTYTRVETDDTAPEPPHTPCQAPCTLHPDDTPVHTHTDCLTPPVSTAPPPPRSYFRDSCDFTVQRAASTRIARTDYTAVVLREFRSETRPSVPPFMTSCARRSPHCIRLVSVASTAGPHYENRNRRSSSESWPSAFASPPTVPSKTRRFLSCSRRMRSSTVLRTTNRTAQMGLC